MPNLLFSHRAWRESILVTRHRRLQSHSCSICYFTAFRVRWLLPTCFLLWFLWTCFMSHTPGCVLAVAMHCLVCSWTLIDWYIQCLTDDIREFRLHRACILYCLLLRLHWRRPCLPRQYSVEHLLDKNILHSYVRSWLLPCFLLHIRCELSFIFSDQLMLACMSVI